MGEAGGRSVELDFFAAEELDEALAGPLAVYRLRGAGPGAEDVTGVGGRPFDEW